MKYNFIVGTNLSICLHRMIVVAVLSMCKCNNKIEAIKLLRSAGGIYGLREAKDLADFIYDQFEFDAAGTMVTKRSIPTVRFVGVEQN